MFRGEHTSKNGHDPFDVFDEKDVYKSSNGYSVYFDYYGLGFITPKGTKLIIEDYASAGIPEIERLVEQIKNNKTAFIHVRKKVKCGTYWGTWRYVKVPESQHHKVFDSLVEFLDTRTTNHKKEK